MDHSEAVRLRAAEKYVFGELSLDLREEYEEHYFGCHECASDLKATIAFVNASRAVFKTEGRDISRARQAGSPRIGRWFSWLRPAVALPVFAALMLLLGYQNFVTIPRLKQTAVTIPGGLSGGFVSLVGANWRSEGTKSFVIHADKPVIIELDIPVTGEFAGYVCEIQSQVRGSLYDDEVSGEDAKRTVHLIVPKGRLATGTFYLVIFGKRPAVAGPIARTEIDRVAFNLASVP